MSQVNTAEYAREIAKRRTFAIISHPDAGKTTVTEKLLLLGGAIRLAGSVKAKRSKKFATSDWMELEKQRGISVSTSVMNFEYRDYACNLLDTPGHQDFSEDTYRTLSAADCAIMLLDAAKGVEPQTIKLFEVCRVRAIPIFTFVNKMDREARDPLELMHEIETVLGIKTYPMTWPVGSGERFRGVIDRESESLHYFEGRNTQTETAARVFPLADEKALGELIPGQEWEESLEGFEMVKLAGETFSETEFLSGKLSPVFFGSAMTNFGVRAFLEKFLTMAPAPTAKRCVGGEVSPLDPRFSGFVFKIQANMDPRHRDRVAFVRIVSGAYEPGLTVNHARLGREIKLNQAQQFFAQERTTLQKAYAGDIVGLYDPGIFAIGDSVSEGTKTNFEGIPSFAPEHFAVLRTKSALKRKQLMKGLVQLCQEGTVQMFVDDTRAASDPVMAAVGVLQFDVLLFRLKNEYNVDASLDNLGYKFARWTDASDEQIAQARSETDAVIVKDLAGNHLFLFKNDFHLSYFQSKLPGIKLYGSNAKLHSNMMSGNFSVIGDDD